MLIIVAGSNTSKCVESCQEFGVSKLYSMLNESRDIKSWSPEEFLLVDSGAHTWNKAALAPVGGIKQAKKIPPAGDFIKSYYDFISENRQNQWVFVELDVYLDLPKQQIDEMYDDINSWKDRRAKFCRVYHPKLDGGSLDVLREWKDMGQEYIFIANDSLPYLDRIFDITRDKVKVHGLAMTKIGLIEKYPFFSVDSTSPLSTVIFGRYTKPIMNYTGKDEVAKHKSIECFDDDCDRLKKAIIETKATQEYVTELWKKRGVIWEDLKY